MSAVYLATVMDTVSDKGLSTYLSSGEAVTVDGVEYVKTAGGWMQPRTDEWKDTPEAARMAAIPKLARAVIAIANQMAQWKEGRE